MTAAHQIVEMPASIGMRRRWTYAELAQERPETNQPCELWEGDLVVSPAPSFFHQEIAFRLQRSLDDWIRPRRLGKVVAAPIDMVLSPHCVVQPDLAFVASSRLSIVQQAIMGPADLVAEIVSLGSRTCDRIQKRDLYEQYGIREYWIVDSEAETVEVLASDTTRFVLSMRCRPGQTATSTFLAGFGVTVDWLLRGE